MVDFAWDKQQQRYRYKDGDRKGQFVSVSKLQELIDGYVGTKKQQGRSLTDSLIKKDISVSTWEQAIARELKESRLIAYSAGKGGMKALDSRDYGLIGQDLKREYKYLREFSNDILEGKLSEAQIKARLDLYQQNLYASFEKGRLEGHIQNGYRWHRQRRTAKESCVNCVERSNRGWVGIGLIPPIGQGTECNVNCRCYFEYSKEMKKPENNSILKQSFGWLNLQLVSK